MPAARQAFDDLAAADALRQLSNRMVGILHGCLTTPTLYDQTVARAHHTKINAAA